METVHKLVDQGKDLVGQYLNTDASTDPGPSATSDSTAGGVEDGDLRGLSGGQSLPSDRGDATFSGDIERESGGGAIEGAQILNATGRDSMSTFDGGANEDVQNLGVGEMPQ
ncbi:hypothetical protein JCM1841_003522 [Sporobolomyces salmonicolor]